MNSLEINKFVNFLRESVDLKLDERGGKYVCVKDTSKPVGKQYMSIEMSVDEESALKKKDKQAAGIDFVRGAADSNTSKEDARHRNDVALQNESVDEGEVKVDEDNAEILANYKKESDKKTDNKIDAFKQKVLDRQAESNEFADWLHTMSAKSRAMAKGRRAEDSVGEGKVPKDSDKDDKKIKDLMEDEAEVGKGRSKNWVCPKCGNKATTSSVYDEKICMKCQIPMKVVEGKVPKDSDKDDKKIKDLMEDEEHEALEAITEAIFKEGMLVSIKNEGLVGADDYAGQSGVIEDVSSNESFIGVRLKNGPLRYFPPADVVVQTETVAAPEQPVEKEVDKPEVTEAKFKVGDTVKLKTYDSWTIGPDTDAGKTGKIIHVESKGGKMPYYSVKFSTGDRRVYSEKHLTSEAKETKADVQIGNSLDAKTKAIKTTKNAEKELKDLGKVEDKSKDTVNDNGMADKQEKDTKKKVDKKDDKKEVTEAKFKVGDTVKLKAHDRWTIGSDTDAGKTGKITHVGSERQGVPWYSVKFSTGRGDSRTYGDSEAYSEKHLTSEAKEGNLKYDIEIKYKGSLGKGEKEEKK